MRRLVTLVLLLFMAAPMSAFAGSWRQFQSRPLGFTVRYPSTWHAVPSYLPGNMQLELGYVGRTNYSLTIQTLPIKPGGKMASTLHRFAAYEQRAHQPLGGRAHWSAARLGGRDARATIARPSTEGGVTMAEAIYVTQSRHHVYEITAIAYTRPSPANLAGFPAVYREILATLRFR